MILLNDIPEEISNLFAEISAEIRPTENENAKIRAIVTKLSEVISSSKKPSRVQIDFVEAEGSTGIKQTSLRNAADIDLFIALNPAIIEVQQFNSKKAKKEFLHQLFKELNKHWLTPALISAGLQNVSLSYAEHPYLSANYRGMDLDIVLCFNISSAYLEKNGPITAVDRSPHHSRYIMDRLTEKQKDDVRLLKSFFKAHHCYGDKSAVGRTGFIGYSAELLISYYGSLWILFNNFGDMEGKIIATPESLGRNPFSIVGRPFEEVRQKSYPNDFLIILDPTDPKRNVGSSISYRAFYCLKDRISRFIASPSQDLFRNQPLPSIYDLNIPENEANSLFYVDFGVIVNEHYTKFRDKLYSLMDKFIQMASRENTGEPRFEDIVGELLFDVDNGRYNLAFYCPTPVLSKLYDRKGPKIGDEPHYSTFKTKHPNTIEKNGWLWLEKSRKYPSFAAILEDFFSQNPIKNLKLKDIGNYQKRGCSPLAQQNLANISLNILPYRKFYPPITIKNRKNTKKKGKKK